MNELLRPNTCGQDLVPQIDSVARNEQRLCYQKDQGILVLDGEKVQLSKTEARIFSALYSEQGVLLSRNQIVEAAYGTTYMSKRTVDVHLSRIGKKIREVNPSLKLFETIHGYGYKYVGVKEIAAPSSDIV